MYREGTAICYGENFSGLILTLDSSNRSPLCESVTLHFHATTKLWFTQKCLRASKALGKVHTLNRLHSSSKNNLFSFCIIFSYSFLLMDIYMQGIIMCTLYFQFILLILCISFCLLNSDNRHRVP